jgi:hypothetical protein
MKNQECRSSAFAVTSKGVLLLILLTFTAWIDKVRAETDNLFRSLCS